MWYGPQYHIVNEAIYFIKDSREKMENAVQEIITPIKQYLDDPKG